MCMLSVSLLALRIMWEWKRLNAIMPHGFVRAASSSFVTLCPSKMISAVLGVCLGGPYTVM